MKHNKLHGVAHNYAVSMAGGLSFVVPNRVIHTHVFAEAESNKNGYLVADFLSGEVQGAYPEGEVAQVLPLFAKALPKFCLKHNVDVADCKALLVRFIADPDGNRFVVTVEDRTGRRSSREYFGSQGERSETVDELGRRRPKVLSTPLD